MNNKVIATIDISRPAGRKILRELQNKRVVTLEYPTNGNTGADTLNEPKTEYADSVNIPSDSLPEGIENAPTHKEVFSKLLDKLSEHYSVDMHNIVKL